MNGMNIWGACVIASWIVIIALMIRHFENLLCVCCYRPLPRQLVTSCNVINIINAVSKAKAFYISAVYNLYRLFWQFTLSGITKLCANGTSVLGCPFVSFFVSWNTIPPIRVIPIRQNACFRSSRCLYEFWSLNDLSIAVVILGHCSSIAFLIRIRTVLPK